MSADELRKAAETLRERAQEAFEGPWEQTGILGSEWDDIVDCPASSAIVADCDTSSENARYIATVHPGVGLALADWLDREARFAEWDDGGEVVVWASPYALTIAHLINGGAS